MDSEEEVTSSSAPRSPSFPTDLDDYFDDDEDLSIAEDTDVPLTDLEEGTGTDPYSGISDDDPDLGPHDIHAGIPGIAAYFSGVDVGAFEDSEDDFVSEPVVSPGPYYGESDSDLEPSVVNLDLMSDMNDGLDWDSTMSDGLHDPDIDSDLDGEEDDDSAGSTSAHDSPGSPNSSQSLDDLFDGGVPDDYFDGLDFYDDFGDDFGGPVAAPFSPLEHLISRFQSEVDDLTESVRELRQRVGSSSGGGGGGGGGGGESSRAGAARSPPPHEGRDHHPTRQGSPFHHSFTRHSRGFHPYARNHQRTGADNNIFDRQVPAAGSGLSNSTQTQQAQPRNPAGRAALDRLARTIFHGSRSPINMADELHEVIVERRGSTARPSAAPAGTTAAPAFIDLTNSDDEPEVLMPAMAPPPIRNPRRQSTIRRAPSLARSDGSLLGGAPVIDLTGDDLPSPHPTSQPTARNNNNNNNNHNHNHNHGPNRQNNVPRLPRINLALDDEDEDDEGFHPGGTFYDFFRNFGGVADGRFFIGGGIGLLHRLGGHVFGHQPAEVDVQFLGQNIRMDNPAANPLANNAPNLNYGANGYNNPAANDKPPYVPPPPAEEGFTRDTGGDVAVICPSCEEELAYDPEEEPSPPTKKARNKKDQEEHHFWAVKECGHVFCRKCYENRTKTDKTTFRLVEGSTGSRKQVLCGVEDCPSNVTNKSAWVGLFV